jgi:predicted DNA-binding WGR domain protein
MRLLSPHEARGVAGASPPDADDEDEATRPTEADVDAMLRSCVTDDCARHAMRATARAKPRIARVYARRAATIPLKRSNIGRMPRLVYREGKSRKFWHAWVDGLELNVRFGPLGKDGQEQRKTFDSNEAAKIELAKLMKQKLAKGYADGTQTFTFEQSALEVRQLVDPPFPAPRDASLAHEEAGMKNGWSHTFWNGDYAFALEKHGGEWNAGVIDGTGKPKWRAIEPKISGPSFPFGFAESNTRFAVATPLGPAFIVDCASASAKQAAPKGDEILAAALARDHVALLRKKGDKTRLELWKSGKLEREIRCGRQNSLFAFGGGRALMVGWEKQDDSWDGKNWPNTHFIAIDGEPRLLGSFGLDSSYAFVKDGRAVFANDAFRMLEITNLDVALSKGRPISALP